MENLLQKKDIIQFLKLNKNKTIVLCHGVFDLVHYGHIEHFKSAKNLGDILIVSITRDKFIKKGVNRPIFSEIQRYDYLKELKIIDYVYICETESAEDSIKIIKPNFYVKGPDYKKNSSDETKKIFLEKKLVEKFNGKIFYTNDKKFSSSTIINQNNLINLSDDQEKFIKKIKSKYGYVYINQKLKNFKKLKTLLIGELIFDLYCFGNIIGKSGKEPHLVFKEIKNEYYVGGIGAIARNISSFVKNVELIAPFGNENFLKNDLLKSLSKNIKLNFLKPDKNYKSIIKKRFIDNISKYKMFGSYILPTKPKKEFSKNLIARIKSKLQKVDMLIVCDYGHHFLDKKSAKIISGVKKFKALNAQLNSSNIGYHSLNNYQNIDALIINETELRQELREEKLNIKILGNNLIKKNNIKNLIVTQGKNGATLYRKNKNPVHCPAFVSQSVDKVGAGDAMLSISALALKQNLDPEIVLFIGSIAAAISVNNVGNKVATDLKELDRIIKFILK